VIWVLLSEGVKTGENYSRMTIQYGDNSVGQREVYERSERFKRVRTSVDDAHSGLSSIVTGVQVKRQINQRIWDNRRINSDETASEMINSHGKNRCKNGLRPDLEHFILT
jgi:hypothetical protein